ncbi:MAG: hypothetical protein ABI461_06125 [Polyangiaceae bacterium]
MSSAHHGAFVALLILAAAFIVVLLLVVRRLRSVCELESAEEVLRNEIDSQS